MTINKKHECNSPDPVSYKHLELPKRVVPTYTKIYKCTSYFFQGQFSVPMGNLVKCLYQKIFPVSIPCENRVRAELSQYLREAQDLNSEFAMLIYTKYFRFLKVQGKVPSDFRTNWTGTLFPNSQEEQPISGFLVLILKCFLEYDVAYPWHSTAWHSYAPLVVCFFPMGTGKRLPQLCSLLCSLLSATQCLCSS